MKKFMTHASDPPTIFRSLQHLVGSWQGRNEGNSPVIVAYSMTANDTALLEDWKFHDGQSALTIYHMDRNILMAMHYCPLGNQPRLDFRRQRADGTLEFEFVSGTNIDGPDEPHEHAFELRINRDGSLHRRETYLEADGRHLSNEILFQRVVVTSQI